MTEINKINTNPKPVETVYEIKSEDYKIPTFEEFMKSYENDDNVVKSYENELESYDGVGTKKVGGPMYHGGSSSLSFSIKYKFNHSSGNRKNYFKQFGNYNNEWSISGSLWDIKDEQDKLENGGIRVVFLNERGDYEINAEKEAEVKDKLRRDIRTFEKWRCGNPGRVEREFEDTIYQTLETKLINTGDYPGCKVQANTSKVYNRPNDKDCFLQ